MTSVSNCDELAADLESARRVIESHFLAAGDTLTQSIDGIDALTASLDKLVKALDAQAVAAATEDLQTAARTLLGLADNHKARQMTIEQLARHRENLAKCVGDMRASLAYMRAFTVNIKIVSSGIAEAGSTFESFAQEISDCIESGREQLRQLEEEIARLSGDLSEARKESSALTQSISSLLPALPNELAESAGLMGEHYGRVSAVAGEVSGIARNIQMRVGRVLQSLQIGDTTRQRIEHVQAGLVHVMENPTVTNDPRLAGLCYRLLEQHLTSTVAEFHREVDEVEKAMADMAAHSRDLLKLRDMAYGGGKGAGFLDDLGGRIGQALVLVNEIENADRAALAMGRKTASAAEQLGSRISAIQSLKNDVQYMALNTTIKCAQIGDAARPLTVVAIELRDHGRHLEAAAANGLSELDELTGAAGRMAAPEGVGQFSAAEALDVAAKLIAEARARTESEVSVLVSKGEDVLGVLDRSSSVLAFRNEIGGTLESVAAELKVLAAEAPQTAAGVQEQLGEILDMLDGLYTMAQEREVHQAFVADIAPRMQRHNPAAFAA